MQGMHSGVQHVSVAYTTPITTHRVNSGVYMPQLLFESGSSADLKFKSVESIRE